MKGYRTLVFNALMFLVGILVTTGVIGADDAPDADKINGILDHLDGIILLGAPIVNAILRFMTNTPAGQKV